MLSGGLIEKIGTVEAGGRITGDLIVEGDLTVEGSSTYVYDTEVQGGTLIDTTDVEALLVRKASDTGDVFTVDSSNEIIQINSHDGLTKGLKLGTTLVTATATELNILDGATLSTTELNYVDGVTSAIQTQIDTKAPIASPTFTGTITIGSAEISEAELEILDGATVTTAELNILDGVTATATEINYLDITTLGTVEASKAVTADVSGNIDFNNGNMTNVDIDSGAIDGTNITVGATKTLDVSAGTLTLADNQISGDKIDGGTISTFASTGIDDNAISNALTIDSSQNLAITSGTLEVFSSITTGAGNRDISLTPHGTGEVAVNATLDADALKINSVLVSATAAELNTMDGITASTAELNIMDGVTSTAAELNVLDGVTGFIDDDTMATASATTIASAESVKAYADAQDANVASDTMTFTNKTFDVEGTGNSISNIDVADLKAGVLDTDLSSVSASDDTLASAKAIKAYVDSQDHDASDESVGGDLSGTVSNATIVNDAVTYAKMQNVSATDRVLGRDTAGAGDVEEISPASLRTMINVEDGSTADQTDAEIRTAVENATDSNVFTDADHSKLDGIEASADVTDATNVNAAGAVMESDTSTATMSFVVDEDDMASNSATKLATQQSIKAYVDSVAQGLNVKTACAVATTANITLSGEQSIDGVTTSTSRVLVKDQTDASENGIYVSAAGAWSRATDFDNPQEVASSFVFIESGTTYADTGWVCTNEPESVTVGTDNITFSQFSDAGHITAGTGLTKSGNTLSVNAAQTQITSVGALDAGSITSGFGSIDNGSSTITTTGTVSTGALTVGGNIDFNSGTIDLSTQTVDVTLNAAVDALNFDSNTLSIDASNNRVGIGTASPAGVFEVLTVDSNRYVRFKAPNGEERFQFYTGGTGNAAQQNMYAADGTTRNVQIGANGDSYFNGGDVGIGETSPDGKLHIKQSTDEGNAIVVDSGTSSARIDVLTIQEAGAERWNLSFEGNGATNDLTLNSNSTNNILNIKPDGSVGIGTASPNADLGVEKSVDSGDVGIRLQNNSTTGDADAKLYIITSNASTGDPKIALSSGGGDWILGVDNSDSDKFKLARSNDDLTSNTAITIDSSNNVGIGQTSPSTKLSITAGSANGIELDQDSDLASDSARLFFSSSSGGYSIFNTSGDLRFSSGATAGSSSGTERMRIDSSGSVGIGVSPDSKFHIKSGGNSSYPFKITNSANTNILAGIYQDAGGDSLFTLNNSAGTQNVKLLADGNSYFNGGSLGIGETSPDSNLHITTSTSSPFRMERSGNVMGYEVSAGASAGFGLYDYAASSYQWYAKAGDFGIGTTSPASQMSAGTVLEVKDSSIASLALQGAGSSRWELTSDNGDDFKISRNGSTAITVDGSNNRVGIGTTSPQEHLHIESSANTSVRIAETGGGQVKLFTPGGGFVIRGEDLNGYTAFQLNNGGSNTDIMRLLSSGNVGIGTTNPTYKLDVEESSAGTFPASVVHSDGTTPRGLRITFSGGNSFGNTDDYAIFFEDNTAAHFYVAGDGSVQNVSGTYGSALSDERLKENIVDATGKLDDLLKLKVKNFTFTNDSTETKHIGFIAQEFEQVFPSLVTERDDSEHSGITDLKGLQVGMEFAILVKAIQELSAKNDALVARIEALENA